MADNRYYSILGVTKSATQDEIKKAYKKLALKHHPDRNQGSAESVKIFKDLGEAFEVLSDKDKRSIYDLYGEEGLKRGGGPPPSSASSSSQPQFNFGSSSASSGMPFGSAFSFASGGGGGGGPAGGGGFSGFKARDPNDIFASIFSSSFGGGGFGGGGGINADQFHAMDMDDDFGSHPHQQQHQQRQQPVETPPDVERPLPLTLEELYKGCTKKMKIIRNTAKGTTEDKIVEISVKPGWKVGTKIKFPGLGHENSQGIPGTMIFVIEQKIHTKFERQDNDLIYKLTIPLKEALCGPFEGAPKTIKTLDDRILQIPKQVGVIRPGQERSIYGEGMPISKSGGKAKGDLKIRYEITFPNELSQEKKTALMSIL